jgi:hypothetical protein
MEPLWYRQQPVHGNLFLAQGKMKSIREVKAGFMPVNHLGNHLPVTHRHVVQATDPSEGGAYARHFFRMS